MAAGHMRVLSGYCTDGNLVDWVLIYDPKTGPRIESFTSWKCGAEATWVAPAVSAFRGTSVRSDEQSIWLDSDGDGLSDFDECVRHLTDPSQLETPPATCPTPIPTARQ
jgi:hypothetical protein